MWRRSLNACWAAPNPGVLVTAPERIPAIEVIDVPENEKMTKVVMILRATTIMLSRLRLLPPFLNEEAGPSLQTDRVDKEDQAKFLEKVEQMLVKVEREMSKDKTDEQNPSQAQGNTFYSELT